MMHIHIFGQTVLVYVNNLGAEAYNAKLFCQTALVSVNTLWAELS